MMLGLLGKFLTGLVLWSALTVAVDTFASHTNERADPSVWIPHAEDCVSHGVHAVCIPRDDDGYVFKEDPCVKALLAAMAQMQPFLPTSFDKEDGLWGTKLLLTEDGMRDFDEAHRAWEETKVMCIR